MLDEHVDLSIYKKHGYSSRQEYLQGLADREGVSIQLVELTADMLGPGEDFDGLVAMIQDYSMFAEFVMED